MKKDMLLKRILSLMLTLTMLVSFAVCGKVSAEVLPKPAENARYSGEKETVGISNILPAVIGEDLVLTPEYQYVIAGVTVIQEGVTVRVEPGTHIRFWNDNCDTACLIVNGTFLAEGTKENPVCIYPSLQMDDYAVDLGVGQGSDGCVILRHTEVTNYCHRATAGISIAERCTFRQNSSQLYYLTEDSGETVCTSTNIHVNKAQDCAFYRLSGSLSGNYDRCIMTQCGLDMGGSYKNCVFLGNSLRENDTVSPSAKTIVEGEPIEVYDLYYRSQTGTTYVHASFSNGITRNYLAEAFGEEEIPYAVIETKEELGWLRQGLSGSVSFDVGIYYDPASGSHVWSDGTKIGAFMDRNGVLKTAGHEEYLYIVGSSEGLQLEKSHVSMPDSVLYEIPGPILPTEITFREDMVAIDPDTTYQLMPISDPVQLPTEQFLYESTDETVVAVDHTGLVTPVGLGTADVWVYSLDKTVSKRLTFEVRDCIPLEGIVFTEDMLELMVGQTTQANCILHPEDTTRRNVVITSSDENVVAVEGDGRLRATGKGTATVTAACEGKTATCLVQVRYQSSVKDMQYTDQDHFVLLEDGRLYFWDAEHCQTPVPMATDVSSFAQWEKDILLAKYGGMVEHWLITGETAVLLHRWDSFVGDAIRGVAMYGGEARGYFVYTEDGSTYAMGDANSAGSLGLGSTAQITNWQYVDLESVEDIIACDPSVTFFLTEEGDLYYAGGYNKAAVPTYLCSGVSRIERGFSETEVLGWKKDSPSTVARISSDPEDVRQIPNWPDMEKVCIGVDTGYVGIQNGAVYIGIPETVISSVPNITNAVNIWANSAAGCVYIVTEDGLLYGFGQNPADSNHFAGVTYQTSVEKPVYIPFADVSEESVILTASNMDNGVLSEDTAVFTFNKMLFSGFGTLYAAGRSVEATIAVEQPNCVKVSLPTGFVEGTEYKVIFPVGSITAKDGAHNMQRISVTFQYQGLPGETPPTEPEETTPTEPEETTPTEPTWKEDIGIPLSLRNEGNEKRSKSIPDTVGIRFRTKEQLQERLLQCQQKNHLNSGFYGNAILNPVHADADASNWLRIQAEEMESGAAAETSLGGNWWGTTDETTIGLQMIDSTDASNYAKLIYTPYCVQAPENTFPFVTAVKLFNKAGEEITVVRNEQVTFRVEFNRDMDTSVPLQVCFGGDSPYDTYSIQGDYVDSRTWEGTYIFNSMMDDGYQYFSISNGCAATDDLELQPDQYRFLFEIADVQGIVVRGDMDESGVVTDADAIYLLRHTLFKEQYPISQDGDFNKDGEVTDADAVYLLRHTLFPESYPI